MKDCGSFSESEVFRQEAATENFQSPATFFHMYSSGLVTWVNCEGVDGAVFWPAATAAACHCSQ